MSSYLARRLAYVKRQKIGHGSGLSVMATAIDIQWKQGITRKCFFEIHRNSERNVMMVDDDASLLSEGVTEVF